MASGQGRGERLFRLGVFELATPIEGVVDLNLLTVVTAHNMFSRVFVGPKSGLGELQV